MTGYDRMENHEYRTYSVVDYNHIGPILAPLQKLNDYQGLSIFGKNLSYTILRNITKYPLITLKLNI